MFKFYCLCFFFFFFSFFFREYHWNCQSYKNAAAKNAIERASMMKEEEAAEAARTRDARRPIFNAE